jgi:aryl-alcohol dehydrogenase-like predicted oxidoreductase
VNQRSLGRSGLQVSEIGYGAWGIGKSMWLGAEDDESLAALNRAIDLGVTLIDTALGYGEGHSEQLVGRVVRERSEDIVVASKIPPKNMTWPAPDGIDPEEAFPAEWVRRCTERSLSNLGLDTIDVQQFHVWSDEWVGRGTWLEGVEAMKSEGKIRAFGVSINDHQPANAIKLIESGAVDTVQVIYNVFDQSPEDELLDACAEHGIGVLARVPFDEGSLTGAIGPDTEFPEGDFRNRYFRDDRRQQVDERVRAILDDLGISRESCPRWRCDMCCRIRRCRRRSRGCGRCATWSATRPWGTGAGSLPSRSPL